MNNSKNKSPNNSPNNSMVPKTQTDLEKVPLPRGFPIVGIGASAGGLEAFTQLLSQLPTDTGMAFVLVQHLDPKHESMSAEILSRATCMKVTEVKQGMRVEPNAVYIIPPNFRMGILRGILRLFPRTEIRGQHLVIDFFFRSLAEDQKQRAVGVVLSGTASDGTEGLEAIKAEGGITFAQEPHSARFEGMPQSAIASGVVDLVLSPKEIAKELGKLAHHPYILPRAIEGQGTSPESQEANEDQQAQFPDGMAEILLLLRSLSHVDFTHYKRNTLQRRIDRRMLLHRIDTLKAYAEFLSHNLDEVKALFADILIHVTGFFRDPEAFQALKDLVFPELMADRATGTSIRVWVPGCSTGEEAYSIAISLLEFMGENISETPIQIFATDISEQAIQKARLGEYSESISCQISVERLNRFFVRVDSGGYKISKSIRDLCLFSRHDVTRDPPFARIDLISCRNLLIYFTAVLQKHVIPIFHYALNLKGCLWLGKAESISGFSDMFVSLDNTHKIYGKKNVPVSLNLNFPISTYVPGKQDIAREFTPFAKVPPDIKEVADRIIQAEYPGVLINEEMEILQFRGRTGPFLEAAPGAPSHNLLRGARPEILRRLRMAIQMAKKQKRTIRKDGVSFQEGRRVVTFNLRVIPNRVSVASNEYYYLILFEDFAELAKPKRKSAESEKEQALDPIKNLAVQEVESELAATQEHQQFLIEKYESAQEDLTTANEELQSANEELQSANEELETAKEELQSGNEELTTVNDELQVRSAEQTQTNNDLVNLLGSVQIPIVMLGNDLKIRRFTPLAGRALNLIPTDVGRPLSDLKLNFTSPGLNLNLEALVLEVIQTMASTELEVQDNKSHWYRLQSRPYKTLDGKIDGAVLALVDINDLKLSLQEVKTAKSEAEKANRTKDLFLATLSHELRTPLTAILSWAQLLRLGKLDPQKVIRAGQTIEDCGNAQAGLINDLLDVSRIIMGKLSLDLAEVNPAEVISAAIESVRSTAEKRFIQIESVCDSKSCTVMADRSRLQQVILNLLTNAIKFSSAHSKVSIRLERVNQPDGEKAKILITVTDTGKGINNDFIPYIFDRFSQEDSSSIRIHGGLGLGLAIVRNLVELQGGIVKAESKGENMGATFTVILPMKSEGTWSSLPQVFPLTVSKTYPEGDAKVIRLDGLRVLIVDDQPSTREALTETLRSMEAETESAESAQEALSLFKKFKPHVLVSDIALPGEDGYSLIRKIRALSSGRLGSTPALALTAYASEGDIKNAISAGFQEHLAKPVDGHHLAEVIFKLAGRK